MAPDENASSQVADSGRERVDACPVCGQTTREAWLEALGFPLYRCGGCGHRYAASVFSGEHLSHDYYDEPDEALKARSLVAKQRRFDEYRTLFPKLFARRGSVLDVGCNNGELLSLFQDGGWRVAGIESSPGPADYAARWLKAPVWCGTLENFGGVDDKFELVTLIHVLEHLPDPVAALGRIRDWVAPGGGLLIEVPNGADPLIGLWGGCYRPLCPGDHRSFFDATSLRTVFERAGWRIEHLSSPLHARDLFYGNLLSSLDFVRTRGGRRSLGSGGVHAQLRYRGGWRQPLKRVLDAVVEACDPVVLASQRRLAPKSGAVLIAYATVG